MQKIISVCLVGAFLVTVSGIVQADLTLASVGGDWVGWTDGDNVNLQTDNTVTYGNGTEKQIRWGNPAETDQSGLGFTGVAPPDSVFGIGETFEIGQLRHFNEPIYAGSAATSADLQISLTFSDPAGLSGTFDFTFAIDETPNDPGPPESDDIITFPSSYPEETFDIGGELYTLELLGFGTSPTELLSEFSSPEGAPTASCYMVGSRPHHPARFPLPAHLCWAAWAQAWSAGCGGDGRCSRPLPCYEKGPSVTRTGGPFLFAPSIRPDRRCPGHIDASILCPRSLIFSLGP